MSANAMLLEKAMIVIGIEPKIDFDDGTQASDIVCLQNYRRATFIIVHGDSTAAGSVNDLHVWACDDNAATGAVLMPFHYWNDVTWTGSNDRYLAMGTTATAAAGVTFAGADNEVFVVEVTADEVLAAGRADTPAHDADWVKVVMTENGNDPVVGCIICILHDPRHTAAAETMPYGN